MASLLKSRRNDGNRPNSTPRRATKAESSSSCSASTLRFGESVSGSPGGGGLGPAESSDRSPRCVGGGGLGDGMVSSRELDLVLEEVGGGVAQERDLPALGNFRGGGGGGGDAATATAISSDGSGGGAGAGAGAGDGEGEGEGEGALARILDRVVGPASSEPEASAVPLSSPPLPPPPPIPGRRRRRPVPNNVPPPPPPTVGAGGEPQLASGGGGGGGGGDGDEKKKKKKKKKKTTKGGDRSGGGKKRGGKGGGGKRGVGGGDGGNGGDGNGGDGEPIDSSERFGAVAVEDYDLPPSIGHLSLVLPLVRRRRGGAAAAAAAESPGTASTVSPTDADADAHDAQSVLSQSGTSARDRVAETLRCAQPGAVPDPPPPVGGDGKKVRRAQEMRTVPTCDEDDDMFRPLGPVDVDEARFVASSASASASASAAAAAGGALGEDGAGAAARNAGGGGGGGGDDGGGDVVRATRDGTIDLGEVSDRARRHVRAGRYGAAIDLYRAVLASDLLLATTARRRGGGLGGPARHPMDPAVASTLHNLAVVYVHAGRYGDALECCSESLEVRRSAPEPRDDDQLLAIAASLTELGVICYARDEFSRSLRSLREALQISCGVWGYDHPTVARILNAIGCVHYETGKLIAATATFEESLDVQRGSMGSSDGGGGGGGGGRGGAEAALLNRAATLCNVGMVAVKRGRYGTAISFLEEGHMVMSSVLGDDHRMARNASQNLDLLANLRDDGRLGDGPRGGGGGGGGAGADGGNKGDRRLRLMGFLSQSSPQRVASSTRGAAPDMSQGSSSTRRRRDEGGDREAAALFGDSDGIPKRERHADEATSRSPLPGRTDDVVDRINLGPLKVERTAQQRVRETVLASFPGNAKLKDLDGSAIPRLIPFSPSDRSRGERMKGSMPVDVDDDGIVDAELHLKPIYDQALEHLKHEEYDEALDLFYSVLRNHKDKYGEVHHLVGAALHNIGVIHLHAERYGGALSFFREAVNVRTSTLGPEHPEVAASLVKMGIVLVALQDFDSALVTFSSVLRVRRKVVGCSHPQVAKILNNIGCVHYELGGLLAALKAFEEAQEIYIQECRKDESAVAPKLALANTLCNIGFVNAKRKAYAEAIVVFEEALQIQRCTIGSSHESTSVTLESLAISMAAANSQEEVEPGDDSLEKMTTMYMDMLQCDGE